MTLKVGVVGTGWVAQDRYLPSLRDDPRCDIVALADHNTARCHALARRFGISLALRSHEDLLQSGVEALIVCTPPVTHFSIVRDAIQANVAVLVEKPLATSAEEARTLANLAEERGVVACVSHNFLYADSTRRARALIGSGHVGNVLSVAASQLSSETRRLPRWYPELRGGLYFDEAPHLLYLTDFFAGRLSLLSARAVANPVAAAQPIRYLDALLQGEQAPASLQMNFCAPVSEWRVAITCERAVLEIDLFRDTLVIQHPDGPHRPLDVLRSSASQWSQLVAEFGRSGLAYSRGRLRYGHELLVRDFISAAVNKTASPLPLADGARIVQLMEDIATAGGF